MSLNDTALNLMAEALADAALYLSLDINSTGTESTAGRVAAGWGVAANGDIAITAAKPFTGGASNGAVTHVGLRSAATAGTFYGSFAVTGDQSFNSAGEYTLDTLTIAGS